MPNPRSMSRLRSLARVPLVLGLLSGGFANGDLLAQTLASPVVADASASRAIDRARDLLLHHMKMTDVPGMQVAVWKDGRVIWSEGLGWADVENRAPVTVTTRFPIGSVSKSLTAIAAARLVDRGALEVDADVRRYVPRFPARLGRVTPRMLGQHLSGIRHYRRGERPGADRHFENVDESLELFVDDSLLSEPGTRFSYSSYGFNLLSAVMEAAAGKSFLEVLQDEVVRPLGLQGTMANRVDRLVPFRTRGYTMVDGRRAVADVEDPSYKWAGGGLLSTAEDLVRVGAALLDPGYLSEDARSLLFTEGRPRDGEPTHYGFGWLVYRTREGRPVRSHNGNLDYARAHLVILPEDRLVVAILANTGTSIFFNDGEAVWVSELFAREGEGSDGTDTRDWTGVYTFRSVESSLAQGADGNVRSVPGDTVPGRLALHEQGGLLRGSLTIGARSTPVPAALEVDGTLVLFDVPTWRKVRLVPTATGYRGRWERAGLPSGRLRLEGELLDLRKDRPDDP